MGVATALLVLASALVHAAWNAILKRTHAPEDAVAGVVVASGITALVLALALGAPMPPAKSVGWCVASGVLEAFYFVTLARALARAPLGAVYTVVRGGALVVVWPTAIAFLAETFSLMTAAGTLLVVVGLCSTGAAESARTPGKEAAAARGATEMTDTTPLAKRLGWAAVCAVFVGGYQIAYKVALATGGRPEAVVAISLGTASVASLVTLGRPRALRAMAAIRDEPIRIFAAGTLATLGFAIFLVAMTRAGAGAVVTLRNTSILFAQIIAVAMGERPKRLGVLGALLVTGGAALVAR